CRAIYNYYEQCVLQCEKEGVEVHGIEEMCDRIHKYGNNNVDDVDDGDDCGLLECIKSLFRGQYEAYDSDKQDYGYEEAVKRINRRIGNFKEFEKKYNKIIHKSLGKFFGMNENE